MPERQDKDERETKGKSSARGKSEDEPQTAPFRIREGYGEHSIRTPGGGATVYWPGDQCDLAYYVPQWADKFEPLDDTAEKLKGASLQLQRRVAVSDLEEAIEQAGGEDAVKGAATAEAEAGKTMTPGSTVQDRGVGVPPRTDTPQTQGSTRKE